MGFFSYTCAKTGLPITGIESCGPSSPFSEIVVLESDGSKRTGRYDGYGRLVESYEDEVIEVDQGAKIVLKCFYTQERYADLGNSKHDPLQGCLETEFVSALHHAQSTVPGFDGHQYRKRMAEYESLLLSATKFIDTLQGVCPSGLHRITDAVERVEFYTDPSDKPKAQEIVRQAISKSFPSGLPAGHPFATEDAASVVERFNAQRGAVRSLLIAQLMDAWCEQRPAAELPFSAVEAAVDGNTTPPAWRWSGDLAPRKAEVSADSSCSTPAARRMKP